MYIDANDGVRLHYVTRGSGKGSPIVLVHGWSGSHRYFDSCIDLLAEKCPGSQIYALDLRFHGDSEKPAFGFHVSRLAADLRDFIEVLKLDQPTVVGTSLGCAICWSFVELFTDRMIGKFVFVDQAPSQWKMTDWPHCSKGIYDPASLANIQRAVRDLPSFAQGNAECCLTKPVDKALLDVLTEETLKCDPEHLGKLMADHAQLDWRPILPRISKPCLNLFGDDSGCFPVEGTAAVGDLIGANCVNVVFPGCNHWLYLEEPSNFAKRVAEFVRTA